MQSTVEQYSPRTGPRHTGSLITDSATGQADADAVDAEHAGAVCVKLRCPAWLLADAVLQHDSRHCAQLPSSAPATQDLDGHCTPRPCSLSTIQGMLITATAEQSHRWILSTGLHRPGRLGCPKPPPVQRPCGCLEPAPESTGCPACWRTPWPMAGGSRCRRIWWSPSCSSARVSSCGLQAASRHCAVSRSMSSVPGLQHAFSVPRSRYAARDEDEQSGSWVPFRASLRKLQ